MKMIYLDFLVGLLLSGVGSTISAHTWYVSSTKGLDTNKGDITAPFASISKAARSALAGDTVLIGEGIYREWVSPENGGIGNHRRITYKAVTGEEPWIKGSEVVTGWKKEGKNVWKVEVTNDLFGDFNPFDINLSGDWLQKGHELHLGEVYADNESLSEVVDKTLLDDSINTWYAEVKEQVTVIYANFGNVNPNRSLIEINVRPACFFPKTTGVNYITVSGIKMTQAATQWSAPTSEQVGLIGPNWSKGWVIENCVIGQSKCVGICLGKERASGQNMWTLYKSKFGYMKHGFNREIESILKAYDLGWNKENIGSHLVQNNKIYECGQAGVVGHMGAAFSVLRGNEIVNINRTNGAVRGAETAGIKLHAAIDTRIENNCIVNTARGIWLDWQAQGTHVCGNVIKGSENEDIMIEVSHGPTLIYNNILLSDRSLLINAQGLAFFNNLIGGKIQLLASTERYTPYHVAHSTKVRGFFNNTGGDVRFYNNIFTGSTKKSTSKVKGQYGLIVYNKYPVFNKPMSDSLRVVTDYLKVRFPIWAEGNVYYGNSKSYPNEQNCLRLSQEKISVDFEKLENGYYVNCSMNINSLKQAKTCKIDTEMLGQTFISELIFENENETPFVFCKDYLGNDRDVQSPIAGPFETGLCSFTWTRK